MDFAPGFVPQTPADNNPAPSPTTQLADDPQSPISNFQSPICLAPAPQPALRITDPATCCIPVTECYIDATECYPDATECYVDATGCTPPSDPSELYLIDDSNDVYDADVPIETRAGCYQNQEAAPPTVFELSPLQEHAIELLLTGHSVVHAARSLGIHRVTLSRWKTKHPRFIAELTRRSRLAEFDASLAARQALSISMKTVLTQLRLKTKTNIELATRLLNSPRLARLAASAPVSMRSVLADLHQSRNLAPVPADPADPAIASRLATQLAEEIEAPIPPDPPKSLAVPKPPKGASQEQIDRYNQSHRAPRNDLAEALAIYKGPGEYLDSALLAITTRRPDLLPIDIHYYMWDCDRDHKKNRLLNPCLRSLSSVSPAGIHYPLLPWILVNLIQDGHIKRLGGLDLANCQPSTTGQDAAATLLLAFQTPEPRTFTIPAIGLWRDALTRPDLPIPGVS